MSYIYYTMLKYIKRLKYTVSYTICQFYNLELSCYFLLQDGFLLQRQKIKHLLLKLRFQAVHGADEDHIQSIIPLLFILNNTRRLDNIHMDLI
jgi:hypothetical protein